MLKRLFLWLIVLGLLSLSWLGCGSISGSSKQQAGSRSLNLEPGIPLPDPNQPPTVVRGTTLTLSTGWNAFIFPSVGIKKFAAETLTYNSQTQLLNQAAASHWILNKILYFQRKWYQLSVSNDNNTFTPGNRYWIYAYKNGAIFNFNKPLLNSLVPNAAEKGTVITLNGYNFGGSRGDNYISFNGTLPAPSDYISWSDTTLIVKVPASASSGAVLVSINAETSNSLDFTVIIPPPGSLKWSFTPSANYSSVQSSPAIGADGTIYFGANDRCLYALNPDGSQKWSYQISGQIGISSPAISADGIIYICGGMLDQRLYALRDDGDHASLLWSYTASTGNINATPAIAADGTIYVPNSSLQALLAIASNGSLKWSLEVGDARASAAIGRDGTIYLGSKNGIFYAIRDEGSSGTVKWSLNTGSTIYSSAALAADGTIYFANSGGTFYALTDNGDNYTIAWTYPTGTTIYSSPAIGGDGTIYIGGTNSYLYALYPNGVEKWIYNFYAGASIQYSSPAVGNDGIVYIGSINGKIYAVKDFGYQERIKLWEYPTGAPIISSPTLGPDGTVYIGRDRIGNYGALYALNASGSLAASSWPMFHKNLQHTGR
jgi:outer membrane protein assembly factor BamB